MATIYRIGGRSVLARMMVSRCCCDDAAPPDELPEVPDLTGFLNPNYQTGVPSAGFAFSLRLEGWMWFGSLALGAGPIASAIFKYTPTFVTGTTPMPFLFLGVGDNDPAPGTAGEIFGPPETSAQGWNHTTGTFVEAQVDVTSVVNELMALPGWVDGGNMLFRMDPDFPDPFVDRFISFELAEIVFTI